MKTQEFLNLLEKNPDKELVFEYRENEFVPKAFHITEVKSKHINSVDCGGFRHDYQETVVQLWVSGEEKKEKGMEAAKALKIFNIVNAKFPLMKETPIYFEWGFGDLPTSVYEVKSVGNADDQLTLKLFVPPTVCKPKLMLEVVGSENEASNCGNGKSGCC